MSTNSLRTLYFISQTPSRAHQTLRKHNSVLCHKCPMWISVQFFFISLWLNFISVLINEVLPKIGYYMHCVWCIPASHTHQQNHQTEWNFKRQWMKKKRRKKRTNVATNCRRISDCVCVRFSVYYCMCFCFMNKSWALSGVETWCLCSRFRM